MTFQDALWRDAVADEQPADVMTDAVGSFKTPFGVTRLPTEDDERTPLDSTGFKTPFGVTRLPTLLLRKSLPTGTMPHPCTGHPNATRPQRGE